MLGIYFAPLIALIKLLCVKYLLQHLRTNSFGEVLTSAELWTGWYKSERKQNEMDWMVCDVFAIFYLLCRRETNSFLLVAANVCPSLSPPKWSIKLTWGLWSSDSLQFTHLIQGEFSVQLERYFMPVMNMLQENNSIIGNQSHRFMLYVEVFPSPCHLVLGDLFSFLLCKTSVKILVGRNYVTNDAVVLLYVGLPDFLRVWKWV